MNKRGVSDVVATVIIIALVIVAITVVWVGVMPLIKDKVGSSDVCSSVDVSIETAQGYTCLDAGQGITMLQMKKGANSVNITGFKFFVSYGGNSYYYNTNYAIAQNSYKTFYLKTYGATNLDKFEITPIAKSGSAQKDCSPVKIGKIANCNIGTVAASDIIDENTKPTSSGKEYYIDGCQKISSCQTLSAAGCYRLNQSVSTTGNCFTINSDNVTLDLNWFNVTGDNNGMDDGVYANGRTNIAIKNGVIEWFGKATNNGNGIYFVSVNGSIIQNITATNNGNGIYFVSVNGSIIQNITTSNNSLGLYAISSSNNNNFYNTISSLNNQWGIYLDLNSNNNNFYNTISTLNGNSGIRLYSSSNNNFYNITSSSNSEGITLEDSSISNFNNLNCYNNTNQEISSSYWSEYINEAIIKYSNSFGEIKFKSLLANAKGNLSFPGSILIGNNFAGFNSALASGLNIGANITLYGITSGTKIKKNGVDCGSECYNFSPLNSGTVKFNVTYAGANYSVG